MIRRIFRKIKNKVARRDTGEQDFISPRTEKMSAEMQRETAHHAALIAALIHSRTAKDKLYLALSGAAFLVTVVFMEAGDVMQDVLRLGAALCFLFCMITLFRIFDKHAMLIALLLEDKRDQAILMQQSLLKYDRIIAVVFIIGLVLLFALAIVQTGHRLF